ncbi:MAG TPA: histidine kinase N-terminal 7TM domain-containing protein [Roseiflexaceae bacterium]|nr:histidine kinase N-terminal 7TM domain-containing protein [Roseiflexaceae bacterium]
MSITPYVILYLMPAVTSGILAVYAWRRRGADGAGQLSLLMAAVAFWSLCHTFSIASSTLAGALFWAQVQYGGIVLVGPSWLLFALAYASQWHRVNRAVLLALLIPAGLALAAVLTNGWHQLWWPSVGPDISRGFLSLAITRGPLFWMHAIYSYACVLAGLGLFIHAMLESRLVYRNQARLVVSGALFPIVGNIAHLLGLQTRAVDDPTPFLFSASGLIIFYATRRFYLLDLAPIAQHEIFERMPDGVIVLDRRGMVAAINAAACRLLDIQPATWIGRAARELAGQSPLAAELRALLAAKPTAEPQSITYPGIDGPRVVEVRLHQMGSEGRGRAGALLLLRDVTERAIMERKLDRRLAELTLLNRIGRAANAAAQTDDLLRTITHEIIDAVAWDRVVVCTFQPNGKTLRITIDDSPHDVPSYEGSYLSIPDSAVFLGLLETGEPQALGVADPLLLGTDAADVMGQFGLQTVLFIPLRHQQQPLGALLVGLADAQAIAPEDLRLYETVGQLLSDAITRAQLYEAAHAASNLKSAFLATVSHELRTPLTSIIGYTDMLDRHIFGQLPEFAVEPLDHIRRSGQALLRLINDILDFSKMEAGHFSVDLYPVDLFTVIHSVAGAMRPQIYERGLRLAIELPEELPLVQANSTRLSQILTNLLANAIKFTDDGTITIRAEVLEERVRISVEDTGIGIAPDDQRELFQAFHQVDNQLTRRYGGAGLGLAISRRLLELMEATLRLESAAGAGATFSCELRVAPAEVLREAVVGSGQ